MTPFNISDFLKGQPVVTRAGTPVEGLKEVRYKGGYSYLTAMVNGSAYLWDMDGKILGGGAPNNLDLFMSTPVVYGWVKKKDIQDVEPKDIKGYVKVIVV